MSTPSDPYEIPQYNMIRAHNTFKLGYDNILKRLEDIPMHDIGNFLGYCKAWAMSLGGHHDVEEHVVFPFFNQKLDFSGEIEQHKGIHTALEDILRIIEDSEADPSKFDSVKLTTIMTELREPLYQHLDEEVEHIAADALRVFKEDDLRKMNQDMVDYAKSHGDPFLVVPFMRSHTPPEYKDTWPELPWFLKKIIIPYVLALRYNGYWKYSPYAMS